MVPVTGMPTASKAAFWPASTTYRSYGMPASHSARVESVGATSTTPTSSMSSCSATPSARRWPMTP